MNELERQVRRAHRRLGRQRFLGVLGWCSSGALLVALALVALDMYFPLSLTTSSWAAEACGRGDWLEARMAEAARSDAAGLLGMSTERWLRVFFACGSVAGAMGLGFLATVVWTDVTRRRPLGAAIEIDRLLAVEPRLIDKPDLEYGVG